jgi:hypothetical protein
MKSIEQIAQAAYVAFMSNAGAPLLPWERLEALERNAWIAAVNTVREEIAAVH